MPRRQLDGPAALGSVTRVFVVKSAELTGLSARGEGNSAGHLDSLVGEEFLDGLQRPLVRELPTAEALQVHLVELQLSRNAPVLPFANLWIL